MHDVRRSFLALATIGAGVLGGGCAARQPSGEPAVTPAQATELQLSVTNRNWRDVDIFVALGRSRRRLGRVVAMDRATFALPAGLVGSHVRLLVRTAGSTRWYTTQDVLLGRSLQLDLMVPTNPAELVLTAW